MRIITIIILTFYLISCSGWLSDSTENLSGTYKYVFEGLDNAVIYGGKTKQKVIPCFVVTYNYNDDFMLVFQKATKKCFFPNNIDQEIGKYYYWIIDIKSDTLYRFSTKEKYIQKRKELKIPDRLQLEVN